MRKSKNIKTKQQKQIFRPCFFVQNIRVNKVSFDIVLSPLNRSLSYELMHFPITKSVSSNDESTETRRGEINFRFVRCDVKKS